jgi:hypothetical protein
MFFFALASWQNARGQNSATPQDATIRGRVLEADGKVASPAFVYAMPLPGPSVDAVQRGIVIKSTAADDQGRFEFTGLAPGKWRLTAGRNQEFETNYTVPQDVVRKQVELSAGAVAEVELNFPKAIVVLGRVMDSETKAGVAGVHVSACAYGEYQPGGGVSRTPVNWPRVESISDASGVFRIEIPFNDPARLFVDEPQGWLLEGASYGAPGLLLLKGASAGAERPLDIQLTRGAALRGTVRDEAGAPSPGIMVTSIEPAAERRAFATTDAQGAFALTVPRGRRVLLQAESKSRFAETSVDVPASGDLPEVPLVAQPFASVTGTVKDASGKPIQSIEVSATHSVDGKSYTSSRGNVQYTDSQGVYQLHKVAPGGTTLAVCLGKRTDSLAPQPVTLELKPGATVSGQDFVLARRP